MTEKELQEIRARANYEAPLEIRVEHEGFWSPEDAKHDALRFQHQNFVNHARGDVLALLAEVDRLRKVLESK